MPKNHAVILASGAGERVGYHIPKQFIKIAGKSIVEHTIDVFEKNSNIDNIIIVVNPLFLALMEEIIMKNDYKKISKVLNGGKTRYESSSIGINAILSDDDFVLIHDAVRPFVSNRIINECIKALKKHKAVDVAIPSADTIIKRDDKLKIVDIPERKYMWRGQTPQCFHVDVIKKAHKRALKEEKLLVTDDCGLILKYKICPIYIVPGEERNIKITYSEDVLLAEKIFLTNSQSKIEKVKLSDLKDKVIVIFGAGRGIGKSILNIAKSKKAKTYGFSIEEKVNICSIHDVEKAINSVYKKEKRIDYVINTAAILRRGSLQARTIEDIENEIQTNYTGNINIIKSSIDYLSKSNGGILLFTSSSYTRGRALYSIYSSTKAAVVNIVQALADEFFWKKVKINCMNPERAATPMRVENFGKEDPKTLVNPEKVARESLKTLLSDYTGQVIDVTRDGK
ncbi:MAG: 2-C-methyl-D-erythritol 4-phosphate cytidylyltransferase [Pseudomonadota bacterium]